MTLTPCSLDGRLDIPQPLTQLTQHDGDSLSVALLVRQPESERVSDRVSELVSSESVSKNVS